MIGPLAKPLRLVVSSPDLSELRSGDQSIVLSYPGDQWRMTFGGIYRTGQASYFRENVGLQFSSQDPSIASVDLSGLVTAVSPGQTQVIAQYKNVDGTITKSLVPVSVTRTVPGDFDGNGRIDLEDVQVVQSALNTPALGPFDARDITASRTAVADAVGMVIARKTSPERRLEALILHLPLEPLTIQLQLRDRKALAAQGES